jgi:hypothetical protein
MRLLFIFALEKYPTTHTRHLCAAGLAECLLAEHLVDEAWRLLGKECPLASDDLGIGHATSLGLHFQATRALYKRHFFGRDGYDGYRGDLIGSIGTHKTTHAIAAKVLGSDHPLTRKIAASFLKCFEEQLDWSLDDIPEEHLAHRKLLTLVESK